jgi:HPt (histidine-containing phosphotransfer) domain-containing protein/two-component sensor histidine kinase
MKQNRLLDYLILPRELSAFERRYLARINRIALGFFWAHLPVFIVVALACGTRVWQAILFPLVILAGPTLAYKTLDNPRTTSLTFGVAAMCMGGVLVHLGQGPMQIEMHFYFFVLLALEAVFANPLVVLVSALTVAAHHLALFFLLPTSVFNYQASIWTVLVHALFVVLESGAACFVARSFFDNVIGLDKIVRSRTAALDARNDDMRLVLGNVGQGFLTVDREGKMSVERSAAVARWFGEAPANRSFSQYLASVDPSYAAWFDVAFAEVLEGVMPLEITIEQLPHRLCRGDTTWELTFRPIEVNGAVDKLLVVISDVTSELERERAEAERKELNQIVERAMRDPDAVTELMNEGQVIVDRIASGDCAAEDLARLIHTLKGNTAIFGVVSVSSTCHEVEGAILERGEALEKDADQIEEAWNSFRERMAPFLRALTARLVTLSEEEHAGFLTKLAQGRPRSELLRIAADWAREPAELRFARIAEQLQATAQRLGKPAPIIQTQTAGVRLPRDRWGSFWAAFVHAVRNALDHGIEEPDTRKENGKSERGHIALVAHAMKGQVEIALSDDGRGIDWESVRARATALGLPSETRDDLVEALFYDGLSTKDEATEVSGRGVGLGALEKACAELGGEIVIESQQGLGTTIRARIPLQDEGLLAAIANDVTSRRSGSVSTSSSTSTSPPAA